MHPIANLNVSHAIEILPSTQGTWIIKIKYYLSNFRVKSFKRINMAILLYFFTFSFSLKVISGDTFLRIQDSRFEIPF